MVLVRATSSSRSSRFWWQFLQREREIWELLTFEPLDLGGKFSFIVLWDVYFEDDIKTQFHVWNVISDQVNAALKGETEKFRKLAVGGEEKPDVGIKRNGECWSNWIHLRSQHAVNLIYNESVEAGQISGTPYILWCFQDFGHSNRQNYSLYATVCYERICFYPSHFGRAQFELCTIR